MVSLEFCLNIVKSIFKVCIRSNHSTMATLGTDEGGLGSTLLGIQLPSVSK